MKKPSRTQPLRQWLKGLLERRGARIPMPDAGYDGVPKNLADKVELVSRIENITWKEAANLLIEEGFSEHIVKKVAEDDEIKRQAGELNLPRRGHTTRFSREVRKFAIEHGTNISKR